MQYLCNSYFGYCTRSQSHQEVSLKLQSSWYIINDLNNASIYQIIFHAKTSEDIHFGPEKWKEKKQKWKTCSSRLYAYDRSWRKKLVSFFFFYMNWIWKKKLVTIILETKRNKNENFVKKLVTIILLELVCLLLRFFSFWRESKK